MFPEKKLLWTKARLLLIAIVVFGSFAFLSGYGVFYLATHFQNKEVWKFCMLLYVCAPLHIMSLWTLITAIRLVTTDHSLSFLERSVKEILFPRNVSSGIMNYTRDRDVKEAFIQLLTSLEDGNTTSFRVDPINLKVGFLSDKGWRNIDLPSSRICWGVIGCIRKIANLGDEVGDRCQIGQFSPDFLENDFSVLIEPSLGGEQATVSIFTGEELK